MNLPNKLTIARIIAVPFFIISYYLGWYIPAFIIFILASVTDTLDGKIAKLAGKTSKKGDYLDHVFDRYADVFMIGGVAVSAWCDPYLGMLALVGVLLTSYMGTQAQAIGAPRLYAGLLGRADRVVLSTVFPVIQYVAMHFGYGSFEIFGFGLNWMEIMMLWFAVVGNLTAVQRAIITWRNLNKEGRGRLSPSFLLIGFPDFIL